MGAGVREINIQNEIRVALSEYGLVFRCNAGRAWQGTVVYDTQRNQNILTNLRTVQLLAPGFSDLLFIGNDGRICFIECKRPGEKPRPEQLNFIDVMDQHGIRAGVAYSTDDAIKLIRGGENE